MVPPMRIQAIALAALVTACNSPSRVTPTPATPPAVVGYQPEKPPFDPCTVIPTAPDLIIKCVAKKRQNPKLTKEQHAALDKEVADANAQTEAENRTVAMRQAIVAQCEYEAKLGAMHVRGILMPIAEYNTIYAMCVRARVAAAQ